MSLFENIRGTLGNLFSVGKGTSQVDFRTNNGILEARDNGGGYVPVVKMHTETSTPLGFVNPTDANISFNSSTRVFSVTPALTQFIIYNKLSQRIIVTTTSTITIPNTSGYYYIYLDDTGTVQYTQTKTTYMANTQVAYIYFNTATAKGFVSDERHSASMDNPTLNNLQLTHGLNYVQGLNISGYILNTATVTGITFALSSGTLMAEDRTITTPSLAQPANIPVMYKSGVAGGWIMDTPTSYPFKMSGNYIAYNRYDGSQWLQTAIGELGFITSWVFATNSLDYPLVVIQGQKTYSYLDDAFTDRFEDLNYGDKPFSQMKPLYKLVYQSSSTFNPSAQYSKLQSVVDLRNNVFSNLGTYSPISHCILNDTDTCSHPASSIYSDTLVKASGTTKSLASSTYTNLTLSTKTTDIASEFSTSTYTYTAIRPQILSCNAIGTINSLPANRIFTIRIMKNGTEVVGQGYLQTTATQTLTLTTSAIFNVTTGDTITVQAYQNDGAARNITAYAFSIYSIGGLKA